MKKFKPEKIRKVKKVTHFGKKVVDKWDALKLFLNTKKPGDIFTRQDLFNYLQKKHKQPFANTFTIDTYRNYFTKAGFLKGNGAGTYEVLRVPTMDLTRREVLIMGKNV